MKLHRYLYPALVGAILSFGTAHATIDGWTTDFEAAKKQAADENKNLILYFTGSDWCGYCIKLTKDVFSQDAFKNAVKDKFILVEIDFPKKPENISKLSEALIAQNDALKNKYSLQARFPSVYLTDANGKPFARTGSLPIGPKTYVKHLDQLLAVRETSESAFAEAKDMEGSNKAKSMMFAIGSLDLGDELASTFYANELEIIKASSPEVAKEMEEKKSLADFQNQLNQLGAKKDHEGMIKLIDEKLATGEFEGEIKQQTLIFKAMSLIQLKKPEDAVKTLDEAKAVAPASRFSPQIDSIKKRIEAEQSK
jgi:thioredoxin-related protein